MVASYLIKGVTSTRNYGIWIEFNLSKAQFLGGMEMGLLPLAVTWVIMSSNLYAEVHPPHTRE